MLLLRAAAGLVLGFFLPGYLLARLVRYPWTAVPAFLTSLVVLFLAVFALGTLGVPLRFETVAVVLMAVCAGLGLAPLARGRSSEPPPPAPRLDRVAFAVAAAFTLLMAVRSWLGPLTGADTFFRWEFLALQMRRYGSFAFYPPLEPADFARYFYVDAIPPLVSFAYFWVYECFGVEERRLAGQLVVAQYAAALYAAHRAGVLLAGEAGGRLGLLALVSSPLFFWAFLQGQETGFTTLSLATTLALLLDPCLGRGGIVLAAFAAAAGALAREYGPALVAVAALVARASGRSRRDLALFLAAAGALSLPWYLRTWVLTGNPVYSNPVAGLLPVNELHVALLRTYAAAASREIGAHPLSALWLLLRALAEHAPLQLALGPIAALLLAGRSHGLVLAAFLGTALWAYSVPWTGGGVGQTLRVLAPTVMLASWLLGLAGRRMTWRPALRRAVLAVAVAYGFVGSVFIPYRPGPSLQALHMRPQEAFEERALFLSRHLSGESGRILTDDPYVQVGLSRRGLDVAPIWSPEFSFLFTKSLPSGDGQELLLQRGVRFVVFRPGTFNAAYMQRFALFAELPSRWPLLAEADGWLLYRVPSP